MKPAHEEPALRNLVGRRERPQPMTGRNQRATTIGGKMRHRQQAVTTAFSLLVGVTIMAAGMSGCASLTSVSSGHIGCAERDITITDDEMGWSTRTWTAHCHGRRFYCSAHGGSKGEQVSCLPAQEGVAATAPRRAASAVPPPEPPASAPVVPRQPSPPPEGDGCKYDTQCKGDRICRAGSCVDPGN